MTGPGPSHAIRAGELIWRVDRQFADALTPGVLERLVAGIPGPGVEVLKNSFGRLTVRVPAGELSPREVVVKFSRPRKIWDHVQYFFERSRAAAEWRMNRFLREHGIRAPAIMAWGELRTLGAWRRSVLVMECVPGAENWLEYMKRSPTDEATDVLCASIAGQVARMHGLGIHHRDLHSENILVGRGPDARLEVWFVDHHEPVRVSGASRRPFVDDLGRLNAGVPASRRRRIRFLREYLAARGLAADDWKPWAREIDRRTRRLWDRHFKKRGTRIDLY